MGVATHDRGSPIGSDPMVASRRLLVPIAALFVVQFATALVPFGMGALAPFLRSDYGLRRSEVGLATSLIFAAVAACSIPAGRIADRIGVSRAMTGACLVVATGVAGLTTGGLVGPALALLVVGVGYSMTTPSTNKGVLAAAPARLRGRAMGVKQMGVTAGGAVAAAVLPSAVEEAGVRVSLAVTAGAIALVGPAAVAVYRRRAPADPDRPDGGSWVRPGPGVRRRVFTLGGAIGALIAAQHVVATYLTLFLVDLRSLSPTAAAAYLTLLHVSGTVARFGWGWVSDRLGSRLRTAAIIGAASIVSLLTLAAIGARIPPAGLAVLVVALGAATQGGNAVYQVAISEEDPVRAGWASGIGMTLGFSGAIVGPPVFGAIVDATGSYALGLLLTAALVACAVAVVTGLRRGRGPVGTERERALGTASGSEVPDHP